MLCGMYNCNFKAINYNQFHNILRLFDVLLNFPYTTSKTMGHFSYKHGISKMPHELPNNFADGGGLMPTQEKKDLEF